MTPRRAWVSVAFSALPVSIAAGCQPPPPVVVVQDDPAAQARLTDAPISVFGVIEGAVEYVLDDIAGTARLEDGSVVVALGRSSRVRRYDPDGALLWSAGRRGEGPGEYGHARIPHGCVGTASVIIYDWREVRITVLDIEDGSVMDTWPLRDAPFDLICSVDGPVVFIDYGEESTEEGPYRPSQPLYSWQGGDAKPKLLRRRVPGRERWMFTHMGPHTSMPQPWGRSIQMAASSKGVWLSTGDAYEAEFLNWDGRTVRVVQWTGPDLDFTRDDVTAFEELHKGFEEHIPDRYPSVGGMLTPRAGEGVWVQHFDRPGDGGVTWVHFNDAGTWTRILKIPDHMRLMDIGPDWALVRVRDQMDRDVLHVYELVETN